jgi:hypothetical protein
MTTPRRKATGGGRFDPDEDLIYFLAGHNIAEIAETHIWNLVAVDQLTSGPGTDFHTTQGRDLTELEVRLNAGNLVLLDSGIFGLAQRHRQKHPDMALHDVLSLPPEAIEGFDWLWDTYVTIARRFESDLWGYIELDQGGPENKRRMRRRLEKLGLRPMPVYHPINDGWDYFDELAREYDRIAVGNVVHANLNQRRHLCATLWERRRRYPHLWIHLLGFTLNEVVTVYPTSSCDSSSWVYAIRYGAQNSPGAHAMGDAFGKFTTGLSYDPDLDRLAPGGQRRGVHFLASEAFFMQRTMREQLVDVRRLFGADALLPAPDPREGVRT